MLDAFVAYYKVLVLSSKNLSDGEMQAIMRQ